MKDNIRKGSVKNLTLHPDSLEYQFSDRYSIFDYGEMPDLIPHKGKALHKMAVAFFNLLNESKIEHAFIKNDEKSIFLKNYPDFNDQKTSSFLIPLEVIFRFGIPQGSSYLSRNKNTKFKEGDRFSEPLIEWSTKKEKKDRYLEKKEAMEISRLDNGLFEQLNQVAKNTALCLKQFLESIEIELWDGKLEFAYDATKQTIVLVDSIGIDELRMESQGVKLSKECLRWAYRNSIWKNQINTSNTIKNKPKPLPTEYVDYIAKLYQVTGEAIAKRTPITKDELNYLSSFQKEHKVLVLGTGGREASICSKLAESPLVKEIHTNCMSAKTLNIPNLNCLSKNDLEQWLDWAKSSNISLCILGPEKYIVEGYSDAFRAAGISCLGPGQSESLLESSKEYSKKILKKQNIATANYEAFDCREKALAYLEKNTFPDGLVVKADGLAGGKGVSVCDSKHQALQAIDSIFLSDRITTKKHLIIEERLYGKEYSAFALFDKNTYRFMGTACDYKRIRNNDQGPNTGGMGSYSPCDYFDKEEEFCDDVFKKMNEYFHSKKIDYRGVLFVGFILTKEGPKVLEFNVRFGDPETQSLLSRIKNDLFLFLKNCADSKLQESTKISFCDDVAVHVVCSAFGYPGTEGIELRTGDKIVVNYNKIEEQGCKLIPAGLEIKDEVLYTKSGRVLGLSSLGKTKTEAREKVYKAIHAINYEGMHFRSDIAEG